MGGGLGDFPAVLVGINEEETFFAPGMILGGTADRYSHRDGRCIDSAGIQRIHVGDRDADANLGALRVGLKIARGGTHRREKGNTAAAWQDKIDKLFVRIVGLYAKEIAEKLFHFRNIFGG